MNKYLNMNSKVIVVPIVLSLLFASINLSPSLFLGCFIFVSYVTLTPLRRSCCILGGLRGIPWINLLGQWLSHLKKLNCICDFLLNNNILKGLYHGWIRKTCQQCRRFQPRATDCNLCQAAVWRLKNWGLHWPKLPSLARTHSYLVGHAWSCLRSFCSQTWCTANAGQLQQWPQANKVCCHTLLSVLSNDLLDVYCSYKESKEI